MKDELTDQLVAAVERAGEAAAEEMHANAKAGELAAARALIAANIVDAQKKALAGLEELAAAPAKPAKPEARPGLTEHEAMELRLFTRYPRLFADRHKPMQQTCMCWGVDHGVGWEQILDKLCAQLMAIRQASGIRMCFSQVKEKYSTGRFYLTNDYQMPTTRLGRWADNVVWRWRSWWYERTKRWFPAYAARRVEFNNVWNDIIDACVSQAEHKTGQTCEMCGAYGKMNKPGPGGWYMVRCAKCWEGPGTYDKPETDDELE